MTTTTPSTKQIVADFITALNVIEGLRPKHGLGLVNICEAMVLLGDEMLLRG